METSAKRKIIAATVAGLAVAGGGAAIAATQLGSPKDVSQAILNDAAQQLGVQPSQLSDALKKAMENQIDAAVSAGDLTKAEGDEIKSRIESGDVPLVGVPFHFGHEVAPFEPLEGAASYLGLTQAELRSRLESGKTLAQVATAQGKSVDGLIQTLVDAAKKHLDAAVAAGRITQAQEDSILSDVKQHITDFVNGVRRPFGERHFHGGRPFFGPPPLGPPTM